jgi:hypothetical protein
MSKYYKILEGPSRREFDESPQNSNTNTSTAQTYHVSHVPHAQYTLQWYGSMDQTPPYSPVPAGTVGHAMNKEPKDVQLYKEPKDCTHDSWSTRKQVEHDFRIFFLINHTSDALNILYIFYISY